MSASICCICATLCCTMATYFNFESIMVALDTSEVQTTQDTKSNGLVTLPYARRLGVVIVLLAVLFGAISFLLLLGLTPIEPSETVILTVLGVNACFIALMLFLVGREVRALIKARKRGRAAARMHIRIVGLFGIVAAFPAIIVAIVAGITLDLGLDRIFDTRTRTIVDSSISVAESYVLEATTSLNSHTVSMGQFLNRNRSNFVLDRLLVENLMTGQAKARGLVGASVVQQDATVIVEANTPNKDKLPSAPLDLLQSASDGKPSCLTPKIQNLALCAFKMSSWGDNVYFFALTEIDPTVLNSIQLMSEITDEYKSLESGRLPLQIAFALLYVGICLTILLSAIWMGIAVADRLVEPIRRLISAADEVSTGNLSVVVPSSRSEGDLRSLTETFNSMTSELRTQRDEILDNQEQTATRRRFTEAVLSGVTAGVIGVSAQGRLSIANTSAIELLGASASDLVGKPLSEVTPELMEVVTEAAKSGRNTFRKQISILRQGQQTTLNVQVSSDDDLSSEDKSFVVTIDDITDLVTAQRSSAWADVARRIAHEIKNPLTPIQLSAERIRRRYGKVITEDREVFDQCTETIIRQVSDIGRMVDEFSSFARMPKPTITAGDLREPVNEAVFLLKVGHPEIHFEINLGQEPIPAMFDSRLLGQAFGNVIKNATEAIEGVSYEQDEQPTIEVNYRNADMSHILEIIDNGKGLPQENRQRLLEPYMTTREKGTGLGLAIVGKILEEHKGRIELLDAPAVAQGGKGAMMRLTIPQANPVTLSEPLDKETDNGI